MPIDTSMYRTQPVNVLDVIGGYQNIGLRNQQKQQNALELQKYQQAVQDRERGLQDEMAIRNAMAGLGPDATTDQVVSALRPLGPRGWEKADIYAKNAAERDKAKAALKESEVKAQEQATKKQVESLKIFNYFMNAVGADPRPEVATAAISEIEKRTGEKFPLGEQLMTHAKDPQKLGEVATKWALEAEKRLPKEYQGSTGQFDIKGMRDVVTGQEVGSPLVFQQSMTPAQIEQARHNRAMESIGWGNVNKRPEPTALPKPPKDMRYKPGTDELETIPGSAKDMKERDARGKDSDALKSLEASVKLTTDQIDEILDPKKAGAFNSNFGGWNAYATRLLPGETQDVKLKIESIKSGLKKAGLEIMRSGGSIGQMTVKEWPIVEGMIARIDPELGEKAAREEFDRIKAYMNGIVTRAREKYSGEWGGQTPQSPSPPPKPSKPSVSNW